MRPVLVLLACLAILVAACGTSGAATSPVPARDPAVAAAAVHGPARRRRVPARARGHGGARRARRQGPDLRAGADAGRARGDLHRRRLGAHALGRRHAGHRRDLPVGLQAGHPGVAARRGARLERWIRRRASWTAACPATRSTGLGDSAAWDPIGGRLLVQLGDRVLGVVPGSWLGPDGPQAAAVAIAGLVIPRIAG